MTGEPHCFLSLRCSHTVHLKQNSPTFDVGNKMINRTLTTTHYRFIAMVSHRGVRKNSNPNLTATLHITSHSPARGFNLTSSHPGAFLCLKREAAEINIVTRGRLSRSIGSVMLAMFKFF